MTINLLEQLASTIASSCFFKELTFDNNTFQLSDGRNEELADLVLWLDSHSIIIQAKERIQELDSHRAMQRWFEKKVQGKAVDQICNTLKFFSDYEHLTVRNVWEDEFSIKQLYLTPLP